MRSLSLTLIAAMLCWSLPGRAEAPEKLVEARKLVDDLDMEKAIKVLIEAERADGNDRATTLEIYLLQGIAFGALGKEAKTRDSFRKLLMLDPSAKLPADQGPKVRGPFNEARTWVEQNGPLSATAEIRAEAGKLTLITVKVDKDVMRLARTARFHWKGELAEQTAEMTITQGTADHPVNAPALSWWVELLSDKRGVIYEIGTAAAPRKDVAPGAKKVEAVAAVPGEDVPAVETRIVSGGWRRPTGGVLLGAGVAAAGVGVIFGVMSSGARASLTGAAKDSEGRVTGLTQVDASALETQANTQAALANTLYAVGGALGAAGLVLVIMGPVTEPVVALSPTPGGMIVHGSF